MPSLRSKLERVEERPGAHLGVARVRPHALEALQRNRRWNLRVVGDQRLVGDVRDHELVLQPLRICEADDIPVTLDAEAVGPEVERLGRRHAPHDGVDEARAGTAAARRPDTRRT